MPEGGGVDTSAEGDGWASVAGTADWVHQSVPLSVAGDVQAAAGPEVLVVACLGKLLSARLELSLLGVRVKVSVGVVAAAVARSGGGSLVGGGGK